MRPPCELIQRDFLPKVRSQLAHSLNEEGLSQSEIAEHLEVTQAAIHKYLQNRPDVTPDIKELSDSISEMIVEGKYRRDVLVKMLCTVCMTSRIGGKICALHRRQIDSLGAVSCSICSELLGDATHLRVRSDVLQEIQMALEVVESSSDFSRIVPQVRANLVVCGEDASSPEDVAGVPGRITVISGRARALMPPGFGTSQHTASLLLWAKSMAAEVRACFCISGEDCVLRAAKVLGLLVIELDESTLDVDTIASAVEDKLSSNFDIAERWAIHVPGGMGIEPILYLFGDSAVSLAETCVAISKETAHQ